MPNEGGGYVQNELLDSLHPLERTVLSALPEEGSLWENDLLTRHPDLQPSQLSMALGWLESKGVVALSETSTREVVTLTETGSRYAANRTPELQILAELRAGKHLTIKDLQNGHGDLEAPEVSSAIGALKECGAVIILQGGVLDAGDPAKAAPFDKVMEAIRALQSGPQDIEQIDPVHRDIIRQLHRKRAKSKGVFRIDPKVSRAFALTNPGRDIRRRLREAPKTAEEISALTPEMLQNGSWRTKAFRKYNIHLRPPRVTLGKKHPYRQFLDQVKFKLVAMGFEEMRGPLIETEFWNNDALFMPQFHPARDIHDVYFVKDPQYAHPIEEPFLERVSRTHHSGWESGSKGWRYVFDETRARRLVLRSQGTAVSARTLASGPKIPGKYFSIARCFRYDQVDVTHATDFFQIEGIVLGEGIHFRALLGLLELFAREVALAEEIKFLPAYFPFTEPSVEIHVRHPKLGWMELGGAGLFRPEVRLPLGVNVPVIAWGLGLDRMAMVALGIYDIRDLFSADLDLIRTKRVVPS